MHRSCPISGVAGSGPAPTSSGGADRNSASAYSVVERTVWGTSIPHSLHRAKSHSLHPHPPHHCFPPNPNRCPWSPVVQSPSRPPRVCVCPLAPWSWHWLLNPPRSSSALSHCLQPVRAQGWLSWRELHKGCRWGHVMFVCVLRCCGSSRGGGGVDVLALCGLGIGLASVGPVRVLDLQSWRELHRRCRWGWVVLFSPESTSSGDSLSSFSVCMCVLGGALVFCALIWVCGFAYTYECVCVGCTYMRVLERTLRKSSFLAWPERKHRSAHGKHVSRSLLLPACIAHGTHSP